MKKAVLVVSFGTSYHETREKTIDVCENKIKNSLCGYDFFRAYTSNMIIRKLKKRDNINIDNPIEALTKISEQGYEEVVVQTLHIICGEEYNKLKDQINELSHKFKKITLGRPLLTTIEDYKEAVKAVNCQDSWYTVLRENGYDVKVYLQGLGENPEIQKIFERHAHDCI